MRLLHAAAKTRAVFDDPNLVSHAGLVLAVRLASDAGLEELVTEHVRVAARTGANPGVKIGSLVAGMIAGADSLQANSSTLITCANGVMQAGYPEGASFPRRSPGPRPSAKCLRPHRVFDEDLRRPPARTSTAVSRAQQAGPARRASE